MKKILLALVLSLSLSTGAFAAMLVDGGGGGGGTSDPGCTPNSTTTPCVAAPPQLDVPSAPTIPSADYHGSANKKDYRLSCPHYKSGELSTESCRAYFHENLPQ